MGFDESRASGGACLVKSCIRRRGACRPPFLNFYCFRNQSSATTNARTRNSNFNADLRPHNHCNVLPSSDWRATHIRPLVCVLASATSRAVLGPAGCNSATVFKRCSAAAASALSCSHALPRHCCALRIDDHRQNPVQQPIGCRHPISEIFPQLRWWRRPADLRPGSLAAKSNTNKHHVVSFSPPGHFRSALQHFSKPPRSRLMVALQGTQDLRTAPCVPQAASGTSKRYL